MKGDSPTKVSLATALCILIGNLGCEKKEMPTVLRQELVSISVIGNVKKPGDFEIPTGASLGVILELCGGPSEGEVVAYNIYKNGNRERYQVESRLEDIVPNLVENDLISIMTFERPFPGSELSPPQKNKN